MKLEIVSHCWRYWRAMTYQASSLILNPPKYCDVTYTLFYCPEEDENTAQRVALIRSWDWPDNVKFVPVPIPRGDLCRRAIGRNTAALATEADLVWFIDCDMTLEQGAIDTLADRVWRQPDKVLFYPAHVMVPSQEAGDKIIFAATELTEPVALDHSTFTRHRYGRAIGGVQIVRGDVCREVGYLNGKEKWQRPSHEWRRTYEDRAYRGWLDSKYKCRRGHRLSVDGVCRIRHTQRGRFDRGLEL